MTGKRPETRERCPICSRPTVAEHRPFCSRRCRDVDLARWMTGRYALPGPPAPPDAEGEAG
jgi:hypothetical protein